MLLDSNSLNERQSKVKLEIKTSITETERKAVQQKNLDDIADRLVAICQGCKSVKVMIIQLP